MATPLHVSVWVGLDVGKSDHYAVVLDNDGESLFARKVLNLESDIEALLAGAGEHGRVGLVIDQPGSIAQLAIAVAARRDVPVAYVPGLVMRRAADLYPGEAKTDQRDAYVIADTARTRRRQVQWLDAHNDDLLDELRVLNGYDVDLAADVTRLTNRLRDALTSISPPLEQALGTKLHHAGVRALLAAHPTTTALRAAGHDAILAVIAEHNPRAAAKLSGNVATALDAQDLTLPAEHTVGQVIADLAADLHRVRARREDLAAQIEEVFRAHPLGEVLLSMPGIGPRTGPRILAEIGDGSRFGDGSHLASYAGLAPVTRQSGTSIKGESKSRRGNHRLKNAMFQAAFASLSSPDSRTFYDRKRVEGKKHNAAIICLARRRCNVILAMVRDNTHYQPPTPAEVTNVTTADEKIAA